jgi:uncharacterized protein YfaP (DUF2135 family)
MVFTNFLQHMHNPIAATGILIMGLLITGQAVAQGQSPSLQAPAGGWRATVGDSNFVQEVNYPASKVNLRGDTNVSAQIQGQIRKTTKSKLPPTLVVNGVAMPLETDEAGQFARPYAFAAGSNSVEVRSADGSSSKRVQFYDAASGGARARLRVVLSWDSAGTDMDLHVVTPGGQHCFYGNRIIEGGGALDVDVTTGYGPEIFATARPERGTYHVYVNYFGGEDASKRLTTAQISVINGEGTASETQRNYRIPLRSTGDLKHVASFSIQ